MIIEKKWLVVIVLACLVEPFHYFLLINFPPPGTALLGYDSDDVLVMGVMRTAEYNFDNPWSKGESVFQNPGLTSPYVYIPIGLVRQVLGIDAMLMNIIAKFVLMFTFLVALYKMLEFVLPGKHKTAFAFFLLPLGMMPLGYLASFATGLGRLAEGFSFEISILGNMSRAYYYAPLTTAMLSMLTFAKGKKIFSGLLLGLTFLFYPFFGFAFSGVLFVYSLSGMQGTLKKKIIGSLRQTIPVLFLGGLFVLPWAYSYLQARTFFGLYSQNSFWLSGHLIGIIGSYLFLAAIAIVAKLETLKKNIAITISSIILIGVVILNESVTLNIPFAENIGKMVPVAASDASGIILITISIFTGYRILQSSLENSEKFALLLAAFFFILATMNTNYIFWQQYRMAYILHIPLAMIAALYFEKFLDKMKSFGIQRTIVIATMGLLAVSSFLAYNYRFQMTDRWYPGPFFDIDDKNALHFMETQSKGVMLASFDTITFLPPWSGQYASFRPAINQYQGGGPDLLLKRNYTLELYAGRLTSGEMKEFLQKYSINYVFYGSREKLLGSPDLSQDFLEMIYDNETKIYRTNL